MTVAAARPAFDQEAFQRLLDARREPAWMADDRRTAWNAFRALDWPSRRDEEWMRTDIRLFKLDKFGPALDGAVPSVAPQGLLSEGVELAGAVTTVNGRPAQSRLKPQWAAQGVLFGSLETLLAEHGDLLRPHLCRCVFRSTYDKFSALHGAFWSGGHVLYVPRGVAVDEPFHALAAMTAAGSDLGRTLVILEDGAQATMLYETASAGLADDGLHCGATELLVGPGANLRYVQLQDWGHGVWNFAHQAAIVERDASLQWTVAALGCRLSKINQHVRLAGAGAGCQVNGVLFTEGTQHLAYHTLQDHEVPHCWSDFLYKAALQDQSRTVWRGMIKVAPGAVKTDGYQRNDNLLLSDQARADSIPGLEIQADDVRCTHGSTTGNVDEELVFYAMCRGFTRKEAVRLIVSGFFQQIFDRITIESVRDALGRVIAARYGSTVDVSDFVRVGKASEVPDPGKQTVEVDDRLVVIVHLEGQFFCLDDVCTHDGGPLGEGRLCDHAIACPRHGAQFDLRTGQALTMPATQATVVHEVKVEGDDLYVRLNARAI